MGSTTDDFSRRTEGNADNARPGTASAEQGTDPFDGRTGKNEDFTADNLKPIGQIDHYQLLKELGTGGFGSVYLARDTASRTFVAVKGLPQLVKDSENEMDRIRENFALAARLKHPNIAAALVLHPAQSVAYADAEVARKLNVKPGNAMLVMDYAPGVPLSKWTRQFKGRQVPLDKAIEMTRQIAAALDYSHSQKVIHRDVKPANVMVETAPDGTFTARVLDFGLAAEVRSSMNRVSQQGVTDKSGTLQYMSPEQWSGKKQNAASDQYALAALFCELVTGDVPFASVFDCGDKEIMLAAVTKQPPEIPSGLPGAARKALARGLAKTPAERYATCGDFVAALGGKKVSGHYVGEKTPGGSGKGLAAAAVAGVLAVAGIGGWWWQNEQAEERARQTELARQEAVRKAETERLAAERKAADEQKARETAAGRVVFALSSKVESASSIMAREAEEVKAVFSTEIRAFENDRRAGNDAKDHSQFVVATNLFAQALAKATALKALVDARAASLASAAKVGTARASADAVDAKTALPGRYAEAEKAASAAAEKAKAKDFAAASAGYAAAERAYAALRAEVVRATLDLAKGHQAAERWQECLAAAEKVLGWEAANAEAAALKAEAERQLKPSLRIVAKIGDREVPATVKDGERTITLPCVSKDPLQKGLPFPRASMAVEYAENGRKYVGTILSQTVNWQGEKRLVIPLKELEYDAVVSNAEELRTALKRCKPNGTIFLRTGDYRDGAEVAIRQSVVLQGADKRAVLLGKIWIYTSDTEEACHVKINSVSMCPTGSDHLDPSTYSRGSTLELDDCNIEAEKSALQVHSNLERLIMRNCLLKGDDKYGVCYISPNSNSRARIEVECFGCQFVNRKGPAVNVDGDRSLYVFDACRFVSGSEAVAVVDCGHDACLFNSCTFTGGKMGIRYGGKSKCYNCTFSGPISKGEVTTVSRKLTKADFD